MTATPAKRATDLVFLDPSISRVRTWRQKTQYGLVPRVTSVRISRDAYGRPKLDECVGECYRCWRTVTRYSYEFCLNWVLAHQCKER